MSSTPSPPESKPGEPRIGEELRQMQQEYEPLLPVEKKLIAWSLGLGLSLLVVLYFLSRFVAK